MTRSFLAAIMGHRFSILEYIGVECIVNTRKMSQLRFDLRKALEGFEARTGIHLTYEALSQRTELSVDTLKSIATRNDYNASMKNLASICDALKCSPLDYLLWDDPSRGES
jgi:DNA-binding Xre family transcriptional regulator